MSEPLLSIRNLTKVFGGLVAVDNVSLDVSRGEVLGLLGDNGAGKSTLIKCVSGVYHPEEGDIRFDGQPAVFATPMDAKAFRMLMASWRALSAFSPSRSARVRSAAS